MATSVEVEVQAIGNLSLDLASGFTLELHNVLYVPSLDRNLISVSCLSDYGFDCNFSKNDCKLQLNNKCVGLAFRQDKLYLLSMFENVNAECNNAENAMSANASKKRKRIDSSLKLWHRRLGHISRGRIERSQRINPPTTRTLRVGAMH